MAQVPAWAREARDRWQYRGQQRPPFAQEPGVGQRSVWDFPRPPAIESVPGVMRVCIGGHEIAHTSRGLRVLETASPPTYYVPPEDVDASVLRRASESSWCEWKGEAAYWDLVLCGNSADAKGEKSQELGRARRAVLSVHFQHTDWPIFVPMNTLHLQFLMLIFAGWVNRGQQDVIAYLQEENRVLREQLGGKRLLFTDRQRRLLAAKAKVIGRKGLFEISTLVTPDTLLRWYRRLISRKYDGSKSRTAGRPRTAAEIEELILQMARANPTWGYTRIRGALYNLGHEIGRNTIKRILLDRGLDPAPLRGRTMSWETFLKAHWGAIAATDFFSVEVLTRVGLVRYFVLFVIDLRTRRVEIAGIAPQPDGEWMKQMARNLTDVDDGFLKGTRYFIHDRDPLFTQRFRGILKSSGVKTVRLPARSPDLNAYAERFVLSVKSECLAKIIPLGERHLRKAVKEYTEHYHLERNHQGLDNELVEMPTDSPDRGGAVECRERLGGILNYYHRRAA